MKILSFDTSGSLIQLSLQDGKKTILEQEIEAVKQKRQETASLLLPTIDAALKEAGWAKSALDLIVVGIGPGSFTGVRVAVTTARTLGQALNIPVIGVSSLEAIAFAGTRPSAVLMQAGSGKFFAAAYEDTDAELVKISVVPACAELDTLLNDISFVKVWFADEVSAQALQNAGQDYLAYPHIKNIATVAANLSYDRLSWKEPMTSKTDTRQTLLNRFPWQSVLPLYLRNPSVTLKAKNESTNKANDAN